MASFAIITPDRGDRQALFDHCIKQMDRFTIQPIRRYIINHKPLSERFDLISRVRQGFNMAKADGVDWVFIIESDDYYPANYFERFLPYLDKFDFIGSEESNYYNLRNQTHNTFQHPYRSSLCNTAFRISALHNFSWPTDHSPFLDIKLWQECARHHRRKFIETGTVGIKHNLGLCGGKGHQMNMRNKDFDLSWLRSRVDEQSFNFYKGMIEQFNKKAA
jgi:hypothetical protein